MAHLEEFDFIVVGAGSAGCVVAARLSEDPSCRVLLLEAGPKDRFPWIHIPIGYGRTFIDPRVNWLYPGEPMPEAGGRTLTYPRGKVMGGSSAINGLGFTRGQPQDFDTWAQLGNRGWSYEDVLPYFRKMETFEDGPSEFRGGDGPMAIGRAKDFLQMHETVDTHDHAVDFRT
jgi:choline dehydrogenase